MEYVTTAERIGIKKGFELGFKQGLQLGLQQGIQLGLQQGIQRGKIIFEIMAAQRIVKQDFYSEQELKTKNLEELKSILAKISSKQV